MSPSASAARHAAFGRATVADAGRAKAATRLAPTIALASVTTGPQDRHRLPLGAMLQRLCQPAPGFGPVRTRLSGQMLPQVPPSFRDRE